MGLLNLLKANSIYKLGFLIFQSLFILILSRILGPESFGTYSLIMVNAALFNLITGWGIPSGIMYHASTGDLSIQHLNRISSWTLLLQLLLCILAEIMFYILSNTFFIWPINKISYATIGIISVISLSLMERNYAFYNGYNAILSFHKISFYFTLFIFTFVLTTSYFNENIDWKILISLVIIIQLIQSLFSSFYFNKIYRKKIKDEIKSNKSVSFFNYSVMSLFANALWLMVSKIDIILISRLSSNWDLGQYSLATRFAQLFYIIPQFLAGILFPWFCSTQFNKNNFEILLRIILTSHLLFGVFIFITSNFFIPYLFGEQYSESIHILMPIILGSASLSVQILLAAYFASQNHLLINIKTMVISLFTLVILDLILIPKFGIIGASLSLAVSYISAFIYALKNYYQKNERSIWDLLKPRYADYVFLMNQLKIFKGK